MQVFQHHHSSGVTFFQKRKLNISGKNKNRRDVKRMRKMKRRRMPRDRLARSSLKWKNQQTPQISLSKNSFPVEATRSKPIT